MRFILSLLCIGVLNLPLAAPLAQAVSKNAPPQAAGQQEKAPMPPDMEKAYTQLAEFSKKRIDMICTNIRPSESKKDVTQTGAEYIARYLAVDTDSVTLEITPAQGAGARYIGSIIYYEQVFECRGDTTEQALAGEFKLVRMRHITELFRYNQGRWID